MVDVRTIISTMIGVFAGWIIAHIYFNKASRAEKIADQIKYGLQKALFPVLYPHFFDAEKSIKASPEQPAPTNTDVPHAEYAVFGDKTIRQGQKCNVLMKLKDSGFDLDNPSGVTVRDHNDTRLAVVPLGLGYVQVTFHTTVDDAIGDHRLTVELEDLGHHTKALPNHNVQSFSFHISGGDGHE